MNRGSAAATATSAASTNGFNEAPIHESGKYPGLVADKRLSAQASMRPRFMNRGSPR